MRHPPLVCTGHEQQSPVLPRPHAIYQPQQDSEPEFLFSSVRSFFRGVRQARAATQLADDGPGAA